MTTDVPSLATALALLRADAPALTVVLRDLGEHEAAEECEKRAAEIRRRHG